MLVDRLLIADFVVQAHEHLDAAEPVLLELERSGRMPAEALDAVFRAVHSIKGAAGFLGIEDVEDVAHVLEGLLASLRDGALIWSSALADPLLRGIAQMRGLLAALPDEQAAPDRELIRQLESLAGHAGAVAREARALREAVEAQRRRGHSLAVVPLPAGRQARAEFLSRVRRFGELVREDYPEEHRALVGSPLELDLLAEALGLQEPEVAAWDASGPAAPTPAVDAHRALQPPESIRVGVALLDRLVDLAGELVLARNQLLPLAEGPAEPLIQGLDRITAELQQSIMHTRLQPLRVLFDRLPRLVRDMARRAGKPVDLVIEGAEVELDRSLLEALADPLTHLLRNAVDHGVESAEQRRGGGKPETGVISLRARAERGRVWIEICDDGAGIDATRVRAAAVRRGAIDAESAELLGDHEALDLIFWPGVSTAEDVTELSGRGVGLDVVRTNVERLGGSVQVETHGGEGTRFRIDVPLTLAIVPALVVSLGGERYALPQSSVLEVARLRRGVREPECVRGREMLRLRGRLLPLLRLGGLMGGANPSEGGGLRAWAVVVRCGGGCLALLVDALHEREEIVVKPLPPRIADSAWYSGCTILGDGRPALILEPGGIARAAGLRLDELPADRPGSPERRTGARPVVIFDASDEKRFAVPLEALLRLERLQPEQVERVGDREFFEYRGRSLRLIHMHEVLPPDPAAPACPESFVLIPRLPGIEAGIAAARIVDTLLCDAEPEPGALRTSGILGSALVKERLTHFLDAAALVEAACAPRSA